MEKITYEDLIEYLKDNTDTLRDMVSEVNSYNGELEDYIWYDNDEYFYEDYFSSKDEVARAVFYGANDYNYNDNYVRFDAYGNLETTNYIEDDMINGAEEILDAFLELYADNNVSMWDEEFKGMISDYYTYDDRKAMGDLESEEDK